MESNDMLLARVCQNIDTLHEKALSLEHQLEQTKKELVSLKAYRRKLIDKSLTHEIDPK